MSISSNWLIMFRMVASENSRILSPWVILQRKLLRKYTDQELHHWTLHKSEINLYYITLRSGVLLIIEVQPRLLSYRASLMKGIILVPPFLQWKMQWNMEGEKNVFPHWNPIKLAVVKLPYLSIYPLISHNLVFHCHVYTKYIFSIICLW